MKLIKNKNLKEIFLPIMLLVLITIIIISMQTYAQYKNLEIIVNEKIADIVGVIKENYPEVDTSKIVEILNNHKNNEGYESGKSELLKYGINVNEINSIISVENQMRKNMILNIVLVLVFNIFWIIIFLIYLKKRDRKIKQITNYIKEIRNKKYELNIDENSEDELNNLKNELYKITVMLKEESEVSKRDKEKLKISVQDISHQLKTPLTSITIMLDNLKDNPNMDYETRQKFIFEINKQIEWINWLVVSLLKLSKLDADVVEFNNEKINLRQFISKIIKNLEIPIEIKNQNIVINGDNESSFEGDYKWQQEAVTNIIKNCIEHNKIDGNIYISYEENNLYTKITIRDEGEGISKEDLRHIFERFYKGKNSSENSVGIGLALSKSIIEKNNGFVFCKSEVGVGTEFVIKYMK